MTPEIQQIIDLLKEAEKYFENRRNPLRFLTRKIEPAFIAAGDALKNLDENQLKDALRTAGRKFSRAKHQFSGKTEESTSEGFHEYERGLRELHRAKMQVEMLNNVESQ